MKELIKEQERSKKYGCNGRCCDCQRIDICPETRTDEFLAELCASIMFVFLPIVAIGAILLLIMM